MKYTRYIFILVLTFSAILFLTLNKNSKAHFGNYRYQLWSDKVGYNIYLPALLIYDFDGAKLPEKIVDSTGLGFSIEHHKIITKYPYGVSLLQLPFWLGAHIISSNRNGFSLAYATAINIAAVCYLIVGLLFLYLIFKRNEWEFYPTLLILFGITFGTNLIYYVIQEGGMSHVYSFFAFSGFIYFVTHPRLFENKKILIATALFLGLILAIRSLNIMFAGTVFLCLYPNLKSISKFALFAIPSILLFYLPQALYNNYLGGNILLDTYKNEGFTFLSDPHILEVLFSPRSGMFPYTPLLFFLIAYLFSKAKTYYLQIICFLIYITIYATWHSYHLGCSYGHRAIIDILPILIFSIPVAQKKLSTNQLYFLQTLIAVGVIFNMKMIYSYGGCFYGKDDWDWQDYIKNLTYIF